MDPHFRQFRRTIYALKRQYPHAVTLCRTTNDATNVETGEMTQTLVKVPVKRAIVLPGKEARQFLYDLSYRAADREFTYGGMFDVKTRLIIVERRDVPADFPIDENMHLVLEGNRYEVKEVHDFRPLDIIVFVATFLRGAPTLDQVSGSVSDSIKLGEGIKANGASTGRVADAIKVTDASSGVVKGPPEGPVIGGS